jgi:hypothetical protein
MEKIVICVDTGFNTFIEINKEYVVIKETNTHYTIKLTEENTGCYLKTRFKIKQNMKPKLNLVDKTQNWCVLGDGSPKMISALQRFSKKDGRHKFGPWHGTGDHYYGVADNEQYNQRKMLSTLYTKEEFLAAFEEYENGWTPKVGEEIEASQNGSYWGKYYFVAKLDENKFLVSQNKIPTVTGSQIMVINYFYIRKIEPKVEINISVKVNNVEKDPSDFTKEEWESLRKSNKS